MNSNSDFPKRIIVALGGNAIHPAGIKGTSEEQVAIAEETATVLLPLLELENDLIITHGNGPGVGKVLMRQALAHKEVAPMSLDICVANTQGVTAYLLVQAFENALRKVGNQRHVVGLVSQVEVDENDPGFNNPTKPVGYFYKEKEAEDFKEKMGWTMKEDSGRGWRMVVASPKPKHICDISLVESLSSNGTIVIAGGGGGVPVVRNSQGLRHGVEAVIDKDLTTAHMANVLGFKNIMILTAVSNVAINFGKPEQKELKQITVSEAKRYLEEGQFPAGSMGPKIEAAISFIEGGGKRATIGHLEEAMSALRGETGTHIIPDQEN
ncbi:carbamate kinase [Deltaproteobacteria bacterium]|nr:carbamate kinase [Deltaproteobacteria bacterium]